MQNAKPQKKSEFDAFRDLTKKLITLPKSSVDEVKKAVPKTSKSEKTTSKKRK